MQLSIYQWELNYLNVFQIVWKADVVGWVTLKVRYTSACPVIRLPNCFPKSFQRIFVWQIIEVNKPLLFDQVVLPHIRVLFIVFTSCKQTNDECQIVFKKFSLKFFLQEAQCIHCIFSHAEKKCLEFGHFVQYFSLSTNQHKWLYEPSNTAVVVASLGLSDSFNRITFLLLCSLYWWKYSMSSTVISSGSSYLLWHDLRYAQICQHSFLELFSFAMFSWLWYKYTTHMSCKDVTPSYLILCRPWEDVQNEDQNKLVWPEAFASESIIRAF